MNFSEQLGEFMSQIPCSGKELSEASGLSSAAISRYRTGEREPEENSEHVEKLATGIVSISESKGNTKWKLEEVRRVLQESLSDTKPKYGYDKITSNLNNLIGILGINMTELAGALKFDASYLSRIRSGQRKPANMEAFVDGVGRFVVRRYRKSEERAIIADATGTETAELENDADCLKALTEWLYSGTVEIHDTMAEFLTHLDSFDLDEYIRAIHFDELKVPTVPFQLQTTKTYYGVEKMKQGELDFFKSTVLAKSDEDIFMCSDMPMEDMAEDVDFAKKWMFAIAMSLKKGLHLNIIHNIDRPFNEMMLGLESWIPIYMTGQVSPYYLKGMQNTYYHHFNYVSGTVALTGECIAGSHDHGKYYLTKNKEEVNYYKQKASDLLAKAQPLMEIYRKENENIFNAFLRSEYATEGNRHHILSSLPLFTIPQKVLSDILQRNNVNEEEQGKISAYVRSQQGSMDILLQSNQETDEVALLSREEFVKHPMTLALSGLFCEQELEYTYEEYLEHLHQTEEYAANHLRYFLRQNQGQAFRNIQISIHEGKLVIISKNKAPAIHFVIRHSKMLNALENFIVPIVEQEQEEL